VHLFLLPALSATAPAAAAACDVAGDFSFRPTRNLFLFIFSRFVGVVVEL